MSAPSPDQKTYLNAIHRRLQELDTFHLEAFEARTGAELSDDHADYLTTQPCIWHRKPCATTNDDRRELSVKGLYKVIGLKPMVRPSNGFVTAPVFFLSQDVYDTIKRRQVINEEHDASVAPTMKLRVHATGGDESDPLAGVEIRS